MISQTDSLWEPYGNNGSQTRRDRICPPGKIVNPAQTLFRGSHLIQFRWNGAGVNIWLSAACQVLYVIRLVSPQYHPHSIPFQQTKPEIFSG